MSFSRYLSKLGQLLNSGGQVTVAGHADGSVTPVKLSTGAPTWDSAGRQFVGTSSSISVANPGRMQIVAPNAVVDRGDGAQTLTVLSNDTAAVNKGGSIGLGGLSAGGAAVAFGSISGRSENGDLAGYLQLATLTSGGTLTERFRLNSSGAAILQGGTVTANGIGLVFPSSQSASSNPNTLDDYEEGDFSLYIADNVSGGNAYDMGASYIKIGRVVTIRFAAYARSTPTWTAGNTIVLRGLPFPTLAEGCPGQLMLNTTRGNVPIHAWQPNGQTYFTLQGNVFGDYLIGSQMQSTVTAYANLVYLTTD